MSALCVAALAAQEITVSIVPSTGSPTALYECSLAASKEAANSPAPKFEWPSSCEANPLKNWERMTPLFPLAPMSAPFAMTAAASPAEAWPGSAALNM